MELEMSKSKVRVVITGEMRSRSQSLILSFISFRTSIYLDSNTVVERGVDVFIAAIWLAGKRYNLSKWKQNIVTQGFNEIYRLLWVIRGTADSDMSLYPTKLSGTNPTYKQFQITDPMKPPKPNFSAKVASLQTFTRQDGISTQ